MRNYLQMTTLAVCGGMMLVFGTAPAQAQAGSGAMIRVERPFRVKIGGFFPTNRETKSEVGRNFFSFGATWDFGRNPGPVPVFYSVFLDSANKSGSTTVPSTPPVEVGTRRGYTGIGVALRNYLVPEGSPQNFYVGGGIGLYQFSRKSPELRNGRYESRGATNTRFGGKFFSGVELPQGYFGEIDYTLPGDSTGNGLTLSVGYRF
ncbi:MAG: hypothetical protein SFU56_09345 [Capsulimonadales bacterium]|nr:hypothetical protein [Capsulimonadales bacterium]